MQNGFFNWMIALGLFCSIQFIPAQEKLSPEQVDSLSWGYYLDGDWDKLIETGKLAQQQNISFKWLQQRLGYAWYLKGDFYKSKHHYQQALTFDKHDELSHLYLYLTNVATGHLMQARYHAALLPAETRALHKIDQWNWIHSVDAEYSYKRPDAFYRDNDLRGDGFYRRIGLYSLPGYRLSVYQSLSGYQQTTENSNSTNQLEYFGSISLQLAAPLNLLAAYHFTGTRYTLLPDSFYLPGHQVSVRASYHWQRFDVSLSASRFFNDYINVNQVGIQWGTGFSLPIPIYLKSAVYRLNDSWIDATTLEINQFSHLVFKQSAGAMLLKNRLWSEVSLTLGNQNYFTESDGVYFYNSVDPVVFKTGLQLTAYISKSLSTSLHYGIEKKHWIDYDEYYYQQGITGGIVWKL